MEKYIYLIFKKCPGGDEKICSVHSLLDNDDGGDDDLTRFSPILNCAVCVK